MLPRILIDQLALIGMLILLTGCLGGGGSDSGGGIIGTEVAYVSLTVLNNNQPADKIAPITVLVAVRDVDNAPLSNIPVSLTSTSSSAFFIADDETDETGIFVAEFVNTVAETFKVTAIAEGVRSEPANLTFITPAGDVELSTTDNILAVGETSRITVTIMDSLSAGQPLPNASFNISVSGSAIPDKQQGLTDANGQATFTVKDNVPENVTVTVTSGSVKTERQLFFGASLSLLPNSVEATNTATLTALLKDSNNAPIADQTVTFNFIGSNDETLEPNTAITGADGTAKVTVTDLAQDGGTAVVKVGRGTMTARATVNFLATFGENHQLAVKTNASLLSTAQSATVTARITDRNGSPIKGQRVNFSVATADGSVSNASLSSHGGQTDVQGQVQTIVSNSLGENVIVRVQADTAQQEIPLYFGANFRLLPLATSGIADGTTPLKLTAAVNDAQGAGIPGIPINFKVINGAALLDKFQVITGELGRAEVGITSVIPEIAEINASVNGNQSLTTEVLFQASVATMELSAQNTILPLGGSTEVMVRTFQEATSGLAGASLPYAPLTITVDAVNNNVILDNVPQTTDASGKATFTVRDSGAGNITVIVTSGVVKQELPLFFGATLSLLPSSIEAVDTATLTALLKDGKNAPIVGQEVTFNFTNSNNETLTPHSTTTQADGTATVTITDLTQDGGAAEVKANAGVLSASATVVFGENVVDLRVNTVNVIVSDNFQSADGSSVISLTVVARDANNAPIAGVPISLISDSDTAFFETLSGQTEENGRFTTTFTNSVAETVKITATAGGKPASPVSVNFIDSTIDPRVSITNLIVTDNFQPANGRDPVTLTVIARDIQNVPLPEVQVNLISTSDFALLEALGGTTGENGRFTTTVTSSVAETFGVVPTAGGVRGIPAQVTFVAPVGEIVLRASEAILREGETTTITITILRKVSLEEILEEFSNFFDAIEIGGQLLDQLLQQDVLLPRTPFNVSSSAGTLGLSAVTTDNQGQLITDANGQASVTLTNNNREKTVITVTSGSITRTLPLYFGATLNLLPKSVNAVEATTLTAILKEANNTPLENQEINFNFVGNNNETLEPNTATTGVDGTATVTITDLEKNGGLATIKANSGTLTDEAQVNFLAVFGVDNRQLEVKTTASVLETHQKATITARVVDNNGFPVEGQLVDFSVTTTDGENSHAEIERLPSTGISNAQGEVKAIVSDTEAENLIVTVQADTVKQEISLYFGATLKLSPPEAESIADGVTPVTLTAMVSDVQGVGISGIPVNFRVVNGQVFLDHFRVNTDESGRAEVNVTNDVLGKATIEAQADTLASKAITTVTFINTSQPSKLTLRSSLDDITPPRQLALSGEATIIASVKDAQGLPVEDGTRVDFTTETGLITSSALTNNGIAEAKFHANMQAGLTTITATVTNELTETLTLIVQPGSAGMIEVNNIDPSVIGIIGSGVAQSATIEFLVKDDLGNPVADDTPVNFTLGKTTLGGGEMILTTQGQGGTTAIGMTKNGLARVTLKSGIVAGNIDVIATVNDNISTIARVIIVGGLPDANHLSVVPKFLNIAGGVMFGLQNQITAYVGDRFGNIVPDNTSVSFISEGGTIGTSIGEGAFTTTTEFGQATATLQSASPSTPYLGGIPTFRNWGYQCSDNYALVTSPTPGVPLCGNPGLTTIVAFTTGSESFVDVNGNGRYDLGEPFEDLSEPYIDGNDDNIFNIGELYIDVNNNGQFDEGNNQFEGPGGEIQNTTIWQSTRVLFSASIRSKKNLVVTPSSFFIPNGGSQTFTVSNIGDIYGNALVKGTKIEVTTNNGILGGETDLTFADTQQGIQSIEFTLSSNSCEEVCSTDGNACQESCPPTSSATITVTIGSTQEESPGNNGEISLIITGTINNAIQKDNTQ